MLSPIILLIMMMPLFLFSSVEIVKHHHQPPSFVQKFKNRQLFRFFVTFSSLPAEDIKGNVNVKLDDNVLIDVNAMVNGSPCTLRVRSISWRNV